MRTPTFVIDFDSTLVTCESLDELARLSLAGNPDRREIMQRLETITRQGMAGEIGFDESLRRRLPLFAAGRQQLAETVTYLQAHISPSALAISAWFAQHSDRIYIISGGFEELIIPIATRLGIPISHVFANRFLYDGQTVIGFDAARLTSKAGGKVSQIAALRLPRPIVAIGDGYTDYEIRLSGAADKFWAFTETTSRPQVIANADRIIASFTEIFSPELVTSK